eukprot:Skav225993  [mRNA]  locus=scaffold4003:197432:197896:+ [translate_table: standard]
MYNCYLTYTLTDDDDADDQAENIGSDCEWDDSGANSSTTELSETMMKVVSPNSDVPVSRPHHFSTREEFVKLENEGLTLLPPVQGCFLSCHMASCQWHAGYPKNGGYVNRAPKWGPGLRSEREALLLTLEFLWQKYHAETGNGQCQLQKLAAAS